MTTHSTRAAAYLAHLPPSISGQHGHGALFRAACVLVHGFALSPEEAETILARDFNPRCSPPWPAKELARKVREAQKATPRQPVGHLLADVDRPSTPSRLPALAPPKAIPSPLVARNTLLPSKSSWPKPWVGAESGPVAQHWGKPLPRPQPEPVAEVLPPEPPQRVEEAQPEVLPYVMDDGTLVIPMNAPDRYRYWLDDPFDPNPPRLHVYQTRAEALERRSAADQAKKRAQAEADALLLATA